MKLDKLNNAYLRNIIHKGLNESVNTEVDYELIEDIIFTLTSLSKLKKEYNSNTGYEKMLVRAQDIRDSIYDIVEQIKDKM